MKLFSLERADLWKRPVLHYLAHEKHYPVFNGSINSVLAQFMLPAQFILCILLLVLI